MSFMMPILTVTCCAWAPAQASATPNRAPIPGRASTRFIACLPGSSPAPVTGASHTEIVVQLFDVRVQVGIDEPVDDPSVFHDVVAVRNGLGEAEILLDQEDGESFLLERVDGAADLLDDDRGEALGRLIEQEEPRAGAQDATDGQHLPLAARQFRALARAEALLEVGEQGEDAVEAEAARLHHRRQQQVLLDAERGEDAAL